jgi:hypothetical protein
VKRTGNENEIIKMCLYTSIHFITNKNNLQVMKVNKKTEYYSEQKIEELSKDKNNIVYRYADRGHVVKDIMSLEDVRDHIVELFDIVKNSHINKKTQNATRIKICKSEKKWEAFALSHPTIFESLVNERCTEKTKKTYLQILYLKKMEINKEITNGRAMVEDLVLKEYGVPEAEYRADNPDSKTVNVPRTK